MNSAEFSIAQNGMVNRAESPWSEQTDRDTQLVRAYLTGHNQEAFTELVRRYWSLVYGVAYRGTGDQAQAKDIAQAVFVLFDRKCNAFSSGTIPAGWLFRTAMFITRNAVKKEARRKEREHTIICLAAHQSDPTPAEAWEILSRDLDEGMAQLSTSDRNALILRFLQNRSFREVGANLGLTEHGARQRALRALERLRKFFRKRGIVYPAALMAAAFGTQPSGMEPIVKLDSVSARLIADSTQKQFHRRRIHVLVSAFSLSLVFFLVLEFSIHRRNTEIESRARRRAIEAVDQALWLGDGAGFASFISLPASDPGRAHEILARYCIAFYRLRRAFDARFTSQGPEWIGSLRLLSWMAGNRLNEQPAHNGRDHAVNSIVPGYSMHLVRVGKIWKWDLFENTGPVEAVVLLTELERQTTVLGRFERRIEEDGFSSAGQMVRELVKELKGNRP